LEYEIKQTLQKISNFNLASKSLINIDLVQKLPLHYISLKQ